MQGCESTDFNPSDFLIFTKPHFQTFNALKSTSFQSFQIISDFFSLILSHPLQVAIYQGANSWFKRQCGQLLILHSPALGSHVTYICHFYVLCLLLVHLLSLFHLFACLFIFLQELTQLKAAQETAKVCFSFNDEIDCSIVK